jgi:sensor histidine kinase regulating citrate/malate metabolism
LDATVGGAIEFLFDDAGCGLPEEFSGDPIRLFECGTRYVPKGKAIVGSGNGLYFTKVLVEKILGGTVLEPSRSARGGALFGFRIGQESKALS